MDNEERDFMARLKALQAGPTAAANKSPEPSEDDLQARLDRVKGRDRPSASAANGAAEVDDLRARLDRLKGRDTPASSSSKRVGSSQAVRKPFPVQKKLTEQEEIDLLLNQVNDDVLLSNADELDFQNDLIAMEKQFQYLKNSQQQTAPNAAHSSANPKTVPSPSPAEVHAPQLASTSSPLGASQALSPEDEVAALLAQLASEPAASSSSNAAMDDIDDDDGDDDTDGGRETQNIVKYAQDLAALDLDLNDPSALSAENIAKISSIKAPKSIADASKSGKKRTSKKKNKQKKKSDSDSDSDLSDTDVSDSDSESNSYSDSDSSYKAMKKKKAEMDKKKKKKWFRF